MKLLLFAAFVAWPPPSPAPDEPPAASFLSARAWRVAPGDTVEVVLPSRAPEDVEWLFFRAAGHQENRDTASPDETGAVPFVVPHTDCALIGLDRTPRTETWPAARLGALLGEPAGEDAAPVRVQRVESMKLLVRVGPPESTPVPSQTAQSKSGQAVELRPLADPTTVPVGSVLPLKVYGLFDAAGRTITARHDASGVVRTATTDRSGIAAVPVTASGVWRVEVHDARRLTDEPDADAVVRSATLTFEARAAEVDETREPEDDR